MQRRELVLFLVILFAGIGLRAWALSRSAVEHFDEGVYASNLWFGAPDYAYPMRRLYAPPLLPALIETGMIAGLAPNFAALLPSFLAGCATVAALWWLGRTWFGPSVGLAAATLCALSDFHIAYSASALTDVLLGLWTVLAVQAIGLSVRKGDLRWAVAGGALTGLAWWTKYNGWLPLAIEAAAIPVLCIFKRLTPGHLRKWLACLGVTAITAAAVWSPYYLALQAHGGYGPIAANHSQYVVGLAGWLDGLWRHTAAQQATESPLSWLSAAATVALAALVRWPGPVSWRGWAAIALASGVALALAATGTSFVFVLVAAPLGVVASGAKLRSIMDNGDITERRRIGLALIAAWCFGLAVATPCYWPYPRLLVPWLLASWIGSGLLIDLLVRHLAVVSENRHRSRLFPLATTVILGLAALLALSQIPRFGMAGSRRNDRLHLLHISQLVLRRLPPSPRQSPRVIYVLGEPAILFQLRAAGEPLVIPVQIAPSAAAQDGGQPIATYLILGPHSLGQPEFQGDWHTRHDPPWDLLATFKYEPSNLVHLDLYDPRKLPGGDQGRNRITLYRLPPDH